MSSASIALPRSRPPARLAATVAVLAFSLAAGVLLSWWIACALLALGLAVIARPFDPFLAMVLVAGVATFVNNEGGHLTRDLSIVTLLVAYALACVVASCFTRRWRIPESGLTVMLLLLAATTGIALVHGLAAQNSLKFIGLELFPILALCSALLVGGLRVTRSDLRLALAVFVLVALVHVWLGVHSYIENRVRTGGLVFTHVPGIVALVVLNLALYGESRRATMPVALLLCLCLLHQLISFTRGLWLGLIVSIPFSCLLYVRHGPGVGARWAKVGRTFGVGAVLTTLCAAALGHWFGWSDFASLVWTRLTSSFGTHAGAENVSNIARLIEYRAAFRYIAAAPWLGHGLGFTMLVWQPVYGITTAQWFMHQSYLLIWLKQGIPGLLALIAVLFTAWRLGTRGALRLSGEEAGWSAAAAACTLSLAVMALTNMTFNSVNGNFLLALLWGVALSGSEPRRTWFTWRAETE